MLFRSLKTDTAVGARGDSQLHVIPKDTIVKIPGLSVLPTDSIKQTETTEQTISTADDVSAPNVDRQSSTGKKEGKTADDTSNE